MRSHPTRFVLLPLGLGVVAVTLAGCFSTASPMATAEQTPAAAARATPRPTFDGSTREGVLLQAASAELDPGVLPAGFRFVETVDLDLAGSTSSVYVQGQPEDQGPGLYVHAMHAGVTVEGLGDGWVFEEVPELSGEETVTVASHPEGLERTVVSIDASPAGTVRLIGDGVPRDELVATAGRLLSSVDDLG
ncbi:hypothetical protein EQW78_01980 [Oerskovia turbata]|uniref:DUF4245 domain-containing protein n=1 Tax=Oerskovia turbata TaxID=1713 RepID=A0A4Q1L260_9CELL|nr:hypothetical protein [Oerskovia turbata]RXR27072.1 hypothetical protein EQW73_06440 [Oerskovia turbata]RXR36360.1 hypothetical protein EQW78_01980 [Oerskovia turbata]TGJ95475.1 hypothetical protein DLJ96_13065 [Actinotalea fermentans ATCC 43279 = JCM 9966 = DSM 3133]